jgi:adenylate cyclase
MKQRLAAILAADAAGYSRLMSVDEHATVAALDAARTTFRTQIEAKQGRVVDMAGDSVLGVFDAAAGAVAAAMTVQAELAKSLVDLPEDRRMRFRIGIHLGDVIEKADGTVYGDGVNIAARLQGLAEPGGITVSESVRTAVKGKVAADFDDRGEQSVKNIADPVRAHAVRPPGSILRAVTGIDISQPVPGFGGRPAIAVLPFENLSGDPEQEYFADGLAEDILTRLAMQRWFPVIARNSSFTFRGCTVDVKEVGRALGARYVLEGSVRKAGSRVRVTGQLIDATTGHHLWAERYDRELTDLFAIQDELTEGIVGVLEAAVGWAEAERAHLKPPANLDAYDLTMRGYWHFRRTTREELAAAMKLFRRALELDPTLSFAHLGIATIRVWELRHLWTADPRQALAEGLTSVRAGIAADPLVANGYAVLGVLLPHAGKHDEALAASRRSIELNPSSAGGYVALAAMQLLDGNVEAWMRACETAIRISPNDPFLPSALVMLSLGHCMAGRHEKAVEVGRLAVQTGPAFPPAWRNLAIALAQLGRMDEAREALDKFLAMVPSFTTEEAARLSMPFRNEAMFQRWLECLRQAGWKG